MCSSDKVESINLQNLHDTEICNKRCYLNSLQLANKLRIQECSDKYTSHRTHITKLQLYIHTL